MEDGGIVTPRPISTDSHQEMPSSSIHLQIKKPNKGPTHQPTQPPHPSSMPQQQTANYLFISHEPPTPLPSLPPPRRKNSPKSPLPHPRRPINFRHLPPPHPQQPIQPIDPNPHILLHRLRPERLRRRQRREAIYQLISLRGRRGGEAGRTRACAWWGGGGRCGGVVHGVRGGWNGGHVLVEVWRV